jgi:hypothetical protein
MAKEICCYCKDGWTPISTSVGGAHVGVIPGEYSNPPMVNVIGGGRLHLHCTFERWPRGWRMQTPGSYTIKGVEQKLPPELARELLEIVSNWAAENPQEFVDQDHESFHQFFETSVEMMDDALDQMPVEDEIAGCLTSRWASLATPTAIKAGEAAAVALAAAIAAMKEARGLLAAVGKERVAA